MKLKINDSSAGLLIAFKNQNSRFENKPLSYVINVIIHDFVKQQHYKNEVLRCPTRRKNTQNLL